MMFYDFQVKNQCGIIAFLSKKMPALSTLLPLILCLETTRVRQTLFRCRFGSTETELFYLSVAQNFLIPIIIGLLPRYLAGVCALLTAGLLLTAAQSRLMRHCDHQAGSMLLMAVITARAVGSACQGGLSSRCCQEGAGGLPARPSKEPCDDALSVSVPVSGGQVCWSQRQQRNFWLMCWL